MMEILVARSRPIFTTLDRENQKIGMTRRHLATTIMQDLPLEILGEIFSSLERKEKGDDADEDGPKRGAVAPFRLACRSMLEAADLRTESLTLREVDEVYEYPTDDEEGNYSEDRLCIGHTRLLCRLPRLTRLTVGSMNLLDDVMRGLNDRRSQLVSLKCDEPWTEEDRTELEFLEGCVNLRRLALTSASYDGMTSLKGLRACPALTELDLSGCTLPSYEGLEACTALTTLIMSEIDEFERMVEVCPSGLHVLDLRYGDDGDDGVWSLEGIQRVVGLRVLLCDCGYPRSLAPLSGLPDLVHVDVSHEWNGDRPTRLRLAPIPAIETLIVSGHVLVGTDALVACTRLKELVMEYCGQASAPKLPPSCQVLDLGGNYPLKSIAALEGASSLRKLDLRSCMALTSLEALGSCTALEELDISCVCESVVNVDLLAPLATCRNLKILRLDGLTGGHFGLDTSYLVPTCRVMNSDLTN